MYLLYLVHKKMAAAYPDERASNRLRNVSVSGLSDFFGEINTEIGPQGLRYGELRRMQEPFEEKIIW
jgi:hypothetical protein